MTNLAPQHKLTERPAGILSIWPAFWFAVCSCKAGVNRNSYCTEEGCPKLCHIACLANTPECNCQCTVKLHNHAGIRDHMTFTAQVTTPTTHLGPSQPLPDPTEGEDLNNLSTEELKALVLNLRKDLASQKEVLKVYSDTIDELAEKQQVQMEALVDTLLAIKDSACTKVVQQIIARADLTERLG